MQEPHTQSQCLRNDHVEEPCDIWIRVIERLLTMEKNCIAMTETVVQRAKATGVYTRVAWPPILKRHAAARSARHHSPIAGITAPHA